jgi:hypothetical protein
MLTGVAARYAITGGVAVIVMRPGDTPRIVTLPERMEFGRRPVESGPWSEFTADDGSAVRVLSRHVRSVTPERHRVDTHGWRDGDDD